MKNKLKLDFKNKKTIIISILIGLILIGLIIFVIFKVTHKNKDLTPNNPTTNEFENYLKDSIKPFDEDSIKDFIGSTDNIASVDEIYWGAMHTDDIDDNIKILYTLSRMIYKDSTLIHYMSGANMFDEDTNLGDVKLSLKFINKALNAKFKDTKIKENTVITDGFFNGINAVICDDTYCIIPVSKTADSNNESDGIYETTYTDLSKVSGGYEITGSYYYSEFNMDGDMTLGVYNNAFKEKTFCEISFWDVYLTNGSIPDECKQENEYDKVKYSFDKNYHFIGSETV